MSKPLLGHSRLDVEPPQHLDDQLLHLHVGIILAGALPGAVAPPHAVLFHAADVALVLARPEPRLGLDPALRPPRVGVGPEHGLVPVHNVRAGAHLRARGHVDAAAAAVGQRVPARADEARQDRLRGRVAPQRLLDARHEEGQVLDCLVVGDHGMGKLARRVRRLDLGHHARVRRRVRDQVVHERRDERRHAVERRRRERDDLGLEVLARVLVLAWRVVGRVYTACSC